MAEFSEPGARRAELAAKAENREILLASLAARFEVHLGMFHDAAGKLLPTSEWTPTMWACVRRVKYGEDGSVSWLELIDSLSVTKLLVLLLGLGSGKADVGRSHLDDLLNEFTGSRAPAPVPVPVAEPAGGAPVDVAVSPELSAGGPRARRSAERRAAWAERERLKKASRKKGHRGDG